MSLYSKVKKMRSLLLVFCIGYSLWATGQCGKHTQKIYNQAKKYEDPKVMIQALYGLISDGDVHYKDTLAFIYHHYKNYGSSYLVTKELLENNPGNKRLLHLQFQNTKEGKWFKEALRIIDVLQVLEQENPFYCYERAKVLLQVKMYSECISELRKGLAFSTAITQQIIVQDKYKNSLAIPVKSGMHFILGLAYAKCNDLNKAKAAFTNALSLAPEYYDAAVNLSVLNQQGGKE